MVKSRLQWKTCFRTALFECFYIRGAFYIPAGYFKKTKNTVTQATRNHGWGFYRWIWPYFKVAFTPLTLVILIMMAGLQNRQILTDCWVRCRFIRWVLTWWFMDFWPLWGLIDICPKLFKYLIEVWRYTGIIQAKHSFSPSKDARIVNDLKTPIVAAPCDFSTSIQTTSAPLTSMHILQAGQTTFRNHLTMAFVPPMPLFFLHF